MDFHTGPVHTPNCRRKYAITEERADRLNINITREVFLCGHIRPLCYHPDFFWQHAYYV
jgi:hypothetical protein